ncbi:MAG: right-handed parallel beta-helix repeat-containing protein, partial [Eubacterium sp.]|nr:right-handed parallel beta-helix repeat-containing protein [Eubacterium sp.]
MKKRFLTILLAVAMVITTMPSAALPFVYADTDSAAVTEELDTVVDDTGSSETEADTVETPNEEGTVPEAVTEKQETETPADVPQTEVTETDVTDDVTVTNESGGDETPANGTPAKAPKKAPANRSGEVYLEELIRIGAISDQTYTGFAIEPEVTLISNDSSFDVSDLKEGTDYTVSFDANTNVGRAYVSVNGIGNYTGEVTRRFTINVADIVDTTTPAIPVQFYTGEAIIPEMTLKLGEYTLVEGTDFDAVYSDNTEAGTAKITITGTGNFTGTKTVNFNIVKVAAKIGDEQYASLEEAVAAANEMSGEVTIELLDDVTWTTGASHGSTPLLAVDSAVTKLTIKGNDNTLTAVGQGIGSLRAANDGTLSFENMTIKDESKSYAEGSWEHGYLEFAGKLNFKDVDFVNAIMLTQDNGQQKNCDATFTDCSFNSNAASEYDVWVSQGDATFNNCTFTGYRGAKTHEEYGSEVGTLTFNECKFENLTKKPGLAVGTVNADTTVIFNDCTFDNVQAGDQSLYVLESDTETTAYNLIIKGTAKVNGVDAVVARIGDRGFLTIDSAFAAYKAGDTLEILKAGEYTLPSKLENGTIQGNVDGVVFTHTTAGDISRLADGVTFKTVTFNFGNVNYHGFQHAGTINMEDCTINGKFFSYGDMNFTECTFNAPGTEASGITSKDYSMWAYSGNITYTDCTFNSAGKTILAYNEDGTKRYTVTAENCSFKSSESNKAAFNVKETCGSKVLQYTVNINNCTAEGAFPAASEADKLTVISGLVQVDDRKVGGTLNGGEIIVNVDGEQEYITPAMRRVASIGDKEYVTLEDAFAEAKSGDTVKVIAGEVELPATAVIPEGVTVKGAGKDATILKITTSNGDGVKLTNPNITICDAKIDGGNITNGGYKSLINVEADGCVIDNVAFTGGGQSTWNSTILVEKVPATGTFTVKNSDISGSFRGVLRESCNANIVINNCEIDAVYPFNIDGGSGGTVNVKGSKLHGWTSYSGVEKVTFTDCEFSKGNTGYDVIAAYVDTEFNDCTFDKDLNVYAQTSPFNFWFNDCEKAGEAVTRENFKDKFPADSDVWTRCDTYVNGKLVDAVAEVISGDSSKEFKSVQKALDSAHEMTGDVTVKLTADVKEVAVVHQKDGLNLTVDGDGKKVTGQFYVDGDGRYNGTDTLTIQNVKFAYDAETYDDAFIDVPSTKIADKVYTTGKYNYAHNITVKDCEFAGEGTTTVAVRVASNAGANKVTITNNKVTGGHSFAQLTGVKDLTITDNTVTGVKNGINISGGDGAGTISGNTLTANAEEGYTVRLKDASGMDVTLSDNTFSGGEGIISNATSGGKITVTDGKYAGPIPTDAAKFTVEGGYFTVEPDAAVCAEGLYPMASGDVEYPFTVGVAVAQIGTLGYASLADAVAASKTGDTIMLLKDSEGAGIFVAEKDAKNITIDLGGHTYTVSESPVGSTGTENQGLHLEKGNTIAIKDGAITSTADSGVKMLVQNYSDLTLDGVTLDGTNLPGAGRYVLSNNNGNVVVKDTTINAKNGDFAFDVCRYATYPSVNVTVQDSSVINGDIEVYASDNDAKEGFGLALNGGTFSGEIKMTASANAAFDAAPAKVSITKNNNVAIDAPEGYAWEDLGNGTSKLGKIVAKIGDVGYASLKSAVAAVPADGTETTITMVADENIDVTGYALTIPAGKNVVLDLNGKTVVGVCGSTGTSALIRNLGTLTINDSGEGGKLIGGADPTWTWDGSDDYSGSYASNLIRNEGTLTVNGGTLYNASAGSAAYAIDNYTAGKVTINGGVVDAKKASAIRMFYNNGGKVTVTGGTIGHYTSDSDCSYMGIQVMSGSKADVEVTGGTIAGNYALYSNATGESKVTISDGLLDGYVGFESAGPTDISITGGKYTDWVGTWGDQTEFITGGLFAVEPDDGLCGKDAEGNKLHAVDNTDEATKADFPYTIGEATASVTAGEKVSYFTTLKAAVEAAEADNTVKLLKNVEEGGIVVDKKITLDLDGKEVKSNAPGILSIEGTGDLTITGNGKITGPENGKNFDGKSLIDVDGGKLTIEDGTLTATGEGSDGMYGVYVLDNGTAVFGKAGGTGPTINSFFAAIGTNNTTAPANITVYGGTYTAAAAPSESDWWSYFCAPIYAAAAGTYDIQGGTFNGYYGISSRYANVEQTVKLGDVTINASSNTDVFVDEQAGAAGTKARSIQSAVDTLTLP